MPQQPTLSVITPNHNHAHFLHEALKAILSQSYTPNEIIIMDDASTDNSVEVIEAFCREHPVISLIRNKEKMGPLRNANRLIELASGRYVYGAAADDKILPGFLEQSMNLLEKYPQAGLCSTLSRSIDEKGNDKGVFPSPRVLGKPGFLSPQKSLETLRKYGSWIKGNTTIYRRDALLDAGGFIPELESYTDGFIQQVIALRHGACFIPKPLACFRELPTNYSMITSSDMARVRRIIEHAKKIMRERYSDLFPEDYVEELGQRWLWTSAVASWYGVRRWQDRYVNQNLVLQGTVPSWVDKAFQAGMRLSIRAQAAAVILYWAFKFRSLRMWLFHRWLKRAK